jgi:hypothetical protein
MAFPVVISRATGRSTDALTHSITIPTGSDGDLLVVVFSSDSARTITIDSGAQWNKLGQAVNAAAVTGSVFWKIAGTGANDILTLATGGVAEGSSHVTLRISGANMLDGTSANGSSTNSNPPLHTPTGGSQDHLWIATRSGDALVVATAAPSGYTNLQTMAALSSTGASTNTAELESAGASQNPGTFTSTSEQWVAWTLAVYAWGVSQTLSAAYDALNDVNTDLSAGYTVYGEVPGGHAWFARLDSGANTWSLYGAAALEISQYLSAGYQVTQEIPVTLTANYSVIESTTGFDDSWFPLLTDGYATWAGETVVEGVGVIDGAVTFPTEVYQTLSVYYSASSEVPQYLSPLYQVVQAISQTLTATYDLSGSVSATFSADYSVIDPISQTLTASYVVLGIVGAVENTLSAVYQTLQSVSLTFTADYAAVESVELDLDAEYETLAAITQTLSPEYDIETIPLSAGNNLSADYTVLNTVSQTLVGAYDVLSEVAQTLTAEWAVTSGITRELASSYQVFSAPEAYLVADYNVNEVELSDLVADVYRYGEGDVNL